MRITRPQNHLQKWILMVWTGLLMSPANGAAAASKSPLPRSDTAVGYDYDYGGYCVTVENGYTPNPALASIDLLESGARTGKHGMYCSAEQDDGYGIVTRHHQGNTTKLAGENVAVMAVTQDRVALRAENQHSGSFATMGEEERAVFGYAELDDSWCVGSIATTIENNRRSDAYGTASDRHFWKVPVGLLGVSNHVQGIGVVGENSAEGTYAALAEGRIGIHTVSETGTAAHFEGHVAAHMEGDVRIENGDLRTNNGDVVVENGDLVVNGALRGNVGTRGGAPFPRPAYDTGWVSLKKGQTRTMDSGLGGDIDNYKVDVNEKLSSGGNIRPAEVWYEKYPTDIKPLGSTWELRPSGEILLRNLDHRSSGDKYMRARIWIVK